MLSPQYSLGHKQDLTYCYRRCNRLRLHCQAGLWEKNSLCGVRAPNKILHTEQDTTHFFFFDGDTIKTAKKSSARGAGPRITSAVNWKIRNIIVSWQKQTTQASARQHAWSDTIHTLYRCWRARKPACAEQNDRMSPMQGGSSLTTAPAFARQMTGSQPYMPRLSSLCSTPSPKAPWGACWVVKKKQSHLNQPQLHDRSNSYPVLWLILKQWSTKNNSQTLRESDDHHGKTLSVYTD